MNKRKFISIGMLFFSTTLIVTGFLIIFMPKPLPLRGYMKFIHEYMGYLMAVFTICHIVLNIKVIKNYFSDKIKSKAFAVSKEFVLVILIFIITVSLAIMNTEHKSKGYSGSKFAVSVEKEGI